MTKKSKWIKIKRIKNSLNYKKSEYYDSSRSCCNETSTVVEQQVLLFTLKAIISLPSNDHLIFLKKTTTVCVWTCIQPAYDKTISWLLYTFSLILNGCFLILAHFEYSNFLTTPHFPKAKNYPRVTKLKGQLSVSLWIHFSAVAK